MTGRQGVFTPEFATTWRRSTGFRGAIVELVMWMALITGVLQTISWLLLGVSWLMQRAV